MSVDESQRLIDALLSPRAYPHPVDEVHLLQTHISWVLLTGSLAYKIKKPVDLGFVDFTTLPRRSFYCQEELRLNRRLAPQLYLDVVAITGTPDAPHIGGDGEAIEYAVQMRQFPQEALASEVLKRGELSPAHIDALAALVAAFHSQAAVAPPESPFGSFASVWHTMQENFEQLEQLGRSPDAVQQLKRWSHQELESHRDDLQARREQGFVRECHGDMHLGNILVLDDRPVVFDCIEFNNDLRWIDVQSEAAFTAMDLEDRGHVALARRYLNAYLEQTGDYAGLALFRYYLAYRAVVRAKVAGIRLQQEQRQSAEASSLAAQYESYLNLAQAYAGTPRPWLAITHGPSGSGKTTIAESLLEATGALRIRSDVERKRLFGRQPLERTGAELSRGIYAPQATERTYARLGELAAAVLQAGFPVIVDATFLKRGDRRRFHELAEKLGVPDVILNLPADEPVLRDRILRRAGQEQDASEADLAVLAQQLKSQEPLDDDERPRAIDVDARQPDLLPGILARLGQV